MSESNTPPTPAPVPPKPRNSSWKYTLALIAVLIAGAVGYYFYEKSRYTEPPLDELKSLRNLCTLLAATQKLAEGYVDADPKDMVADTPKDEAKWAKVGDEITFTVVGTDDPVKAVAEWKDFMVALEKATGKKVKYLDSVETIDNQLVAVREGRLHVTAFNTGAVSTAVNTAGFVPLFAPADKDNKFSYEMEILVRRDAPEKTPADLKGKNVGFVAMSSNSGAKAPMVDLKEKFGLLPVRDYKYRVTGSHMLSVKELLAGKFDAVCVANDLLKREESEGKLDKTAYRSIYTSASFPPLCFGVPHNLPPKLQADVKTAFTGFKFDAASPGGKRFVEQGKVGFAPVNYEKDWEYVRKIDDSLSHLLDGN